MRALPLQTRQVLPIAPQPISASERRGLIVEALKVAAVSAVIVFFVVGIVGAATDRRGVVSSILTVTSPVVVFVCLLLFPVKRGLSNLQAERLDSSIQEAARLTEELQRYLSEAERVALAIYRQHCELQELLTRADFEFADGAFHPFWDVIEQCAESFAGIRNGLQRLEHIAKAYAQALVGRQHTFPLTRLELPDEDLRILQERYRQILRQAQRRHDFADIFGYRAAHKTTIGGFRTTSEALDGVVATVAASADSLRSTLRECIDTIGHGQMQAADWRRPMRSRTAKAAADAERVKPNAIPYQLFE